MRGGLLEKGKSVVRPARKAVRRRGRKRRQSGCQGGTFVIDVQSHARTTRRAIGRRSSVLLTAAMAVGAFTPLASAAHAADDVPANSSSTTSGGALGDTVFGRSGKLRVRILGGSQSGSIALPILQRYFGDSAVNTPGVYELPEEAAGGRPFSLITLLPFSDKDRGAVGGYRVGFWPAERRTPRTGAYQNPEGFIRVTEENQSTYVSEHFQLRDFLTKDQRDVWPKYLVLRLDLIDKLELIIDELQSRGVRVSHLSVMSGFRTPQYNQKGVGRGGRAKDSRHQFGDAADVFVDNNGDGRMDDLNHDGRVDTRDSQIIIDAAERVESRYPDLVGGAGRYRANRVHGPFAHIDVRGYRARWGNA